MDRQDINHYLNERLGQGRYTSQGVKFCCPKPYCDPSESKYNLEVNLSSKSSKYLLFNCWACHYKGHVSTLLGDYASNNNWRSDADIINSKSSYIPSDTGEVVKVKELPLSFSFHLSERINSYLINERKISPEVLHQRKIKYCYPRFEKDYNSIIFPFYDNEKLIGYSSQLFSTKKYKNHRDLNFVAYKEFINPDFPIIITEGVYDALSVPNAIPLLGTGVPLEVYKFAKDRKIILALDSDVLLEDKKKIAEKFYYYGASLVAIFNFDYKDLNDYLVKDKEGLKRELKELFEEMMTQ